MRKFITAAFILASVVSFGQTYTVYHTGSINDVVTIPTGGICIMGGATENDEAMKWFLQRANGGDVLVLRASGSDGYNDYMFSQLGITINSVESIVCNSAASADEAYIQNKIQEAEAIWFAGGDQWDYVSYWRNTAIDSLINLGLAERNIAIGGTSAGMAIQGGAYFTAQNGSVLSSEAMADPYSSLVTVSNEPFLNNTILANTITDTHYDNPDRRSRHVVFMSRMLVDYGVSPRGIACDEYTAVCIDENNIAHVYGDYPTSEDNAYFIQPNCAIPNNVPETCVAGSHLTWNQGGQALKVYRIRGTQDGVNTFDLNDWLTGTGGAWFNWKVNNGTLQTVLSTPMDCTVTVEESTPLKNVIQYVVDSGNIQITTRDPKIVQVEFFSVSGKNFISKSNLASPTTINLSQLPSGVYVAVVRGGGLNERFKFILEN